MQCETDATQIEEILSFWFGPLKSEKKWDKDKAKVWFSSTESHDQKIGELFEELVDQASCSKLKSWESEPRGRLALILLLDQFPRNIYRGTEGAYRFDPLSLMLTVEGIARGDDRLLFPIQRHFFYLPLMHAESLEHQLLSLFLFDALAREVDEEIKGHFIEANNYAKEHFEVIKKFGRFPHRNAVLNRRSSEEEESYLSRSPATYGQSKK